MYTKNWKLTEEVIGISRSVGVTVRVRGGSVGGPSCVRYANVNSLHPFKVELILLREDLVLEQFHLPSAFHQLQ